MLPPATTAWRNPLRLMVRHSLPARLARDLSDEPRLPVPPERGLRMPVSGEIGEARHVHRARVPASCAASVRVLARRLDPAARVEFGGLLPRDGSVSPPSAGTPRKVATTTVSVSSLGFHAVCAVLPGSTSAPPAEIFPLHAVFGEDEDEVALLDADHHRSGMSVPGKDRAGRNGELRDGEMRAVGDLDHLRIKPVEPLGDRDRDVVAEGQPLGERLRRDLLGRGRTGREQARPSRPAPKRRPPCGSGSDECVSSCSPLSSRAGAERARQPGPSRRSRRDGLPGPNPGRLNPADHAPRLCPTPESRGAVRSAR
jgi:hypothetical protein